MNMKKDLKCYEIDNIRISDYPKFSDAYISYAEDENGKPWTDYELDKWQKDNPEKFYELILENIQCKLEILG
jgi:hypothetical protein